MEPSPPQTLTGSRNFNSGGTVGEDVPFPHRGSAWAEDWTEADPKQIAFGVRGDAGTVFGRIS